MTWPVAVALYAAQTDIARLCYIDAFLRRIASVSDDGYEAGATVTITDDAKAETFERVHPLAAEMGDALMNREMNLSSMRAVVMGQLADSARNGDAENFNSSLAALISMAYMKWDRSWWDEIIVQSERFSSLVDPVIAFVLSSYEKRGSRSEEDLRAEYAAIDRSARDGTPWKLLILVPAAAYRAWVSGDDHFIDQLFADAADNPDLRATIAVHLATRLRREGRWREARRIALEARADARVHGLDFWAAWLEALLGVTQAMLGESKVAMQLANASLSWAIPGGVGIIVDEARHAEHLLHSANGSFDFAYSVLSNFPIDADRWASSAYGTMEAIDLAEACQRVGKPSDAWPAIIAYEAWVGEDSVRMARPEIIASKAIIELSAEMSEDLFEDAISHLSIDDSPFIEARVRLAYAHRSSEREGSKEACAQLAIAREIFDSLGAHLWVARVDYEMAAVSSRNEAIARSSSLLSPKEQEVVSLAARGLSNKEIGRQLFISARTVSFHLYNAFPKLGVKSRAALRDAMGAVE